MSRTSLRRVAIRRAAVLLALASTRGRPLAGQNSEAGASFLLAPVGARLVGIGGAGVADPTGGLAFLSNPAAFARLARRDVAFDFGQDEATTRYVVVAALPSRVLGTFAIDAYLSSAGTQDFTDINGALIGTSNFRDVAYAASYAARFGSRLNAGLTYKYVQKRNDCSGICTRPGELDPLAGVRASTSAVDVGFQYDVGKTSAVHLGAAVRNLGLRLQVRDRAQADPLPTQAVVGGAYDLPHVDRYVPDASLRVLAEATTGVGVRLDPTYHVGAEAGYRGAFALRAGYDKRPGEYSGPSFGFGLSSKQLALDVARHIASSGLLADKPPTYVGLRYSF
ncbi:MAG: PorV/PorQ family protein [Gemmatirosa sp.]|nr:PorV/PorQ family protein [Gemmatirosa sp.]